jgi:hypothetical protein
MHHFNHSYSHLPPKNCAASSYIYIRKQEAKYGADGFSIEAGSCVDILKKIRDVLMAALSSR